MTQEVTYMHVTAHSHLYDKAQGEELYSTCTFLKYKAQQKINYVTFSGYGKPKLLHTYK